MTLFKDYKIIDVETGEVKTSNLIVENGLISKITDSVPAEFDGEIIEGNGSYLMPGFINCHTHLAWDGKRDLQLQSTEDSPAISAFKYCVNMGKNLDVGITAVRDLGMHKSNLEAVEAVKQGIVTSPRLYVCGEALMCTGGHTWWCGMEVDGPWALRAAVRKQIKAGAKVIKIMASGSTMPQFTYEEIEAIVDEAHMHGVKVAAHALVDKAIENVAKAGVDSVEHGGPMTEETIRIMGEKKIPIIPTLSATFIQAREGRAKGLPEAQVLKRERQIANPRTWNSIRACLEAGCPLCFGNDAGSPLVTHDRIIPELEGLLELKLANSNLDLLKCLTINGANLIGDEKLGRIQEGCYADFVITKGNPLDDIHNIMNPMVVLNGDVVRG